MKIFTGNIEPTLIYEFLKKIDLLKIKNIKSNDIIIKQIINFMESNYKSLPATVTDIKTQKEHLLLNRRTSAKYTFKQTFLQQFQNEIISIFDMIKENNKSIEQIIVEPSHCDIIYYQSGGEFKFHSDTISGISPGKDYYFYTLLLGLVNTEKGGETLVVNSDTQEIMKFSQSAKRYHYVLFPSTEKHAGSKVEAGIKLCFKFDAWIKFKTYNVLLQPVKKIYSFEVISLKILMNKIHQSIPQLHDLIQKKLRVIICNSLPHRSNINEVIYEASSFFRNMPHTYHNNYYDHFTGSSLFIMHHGSYRNEPEPDYYYHDNDDDQYCNGNY